MMLRAQRGSVLPETALTIGLALLLVLGAAQVAIIGYSQVSADGAAFVAAHVRANNAGADAAAAATTAFPQFAPTSAIAAPPVVAQMQQAVVTKTVGGFMLLPGAAANYPLTGADVEFSSVTASPQPFSFGASATLANYCPSQGGCVLPSSYSMYVAQSVNVTGNGNGWNGPFAEWRCHQQYFASLNFPGTRPTGGLYRSTYDPNNSKGVESPIYSWDGGQHSCK